MIKNNEKDDMSALDRLLAVVTGETPDRVPIYPMIDSLPAELLGLSIEEYFSNAQNVIQGQKKLQNLLDLEYLSNFFYLAIESELFGMDTIFFEEGSPNTGKPIAETLDFFDNSKLPNLNDSEIYQKTLNVTKALADSYKGQKPILSVQSGPFSFPSLLMGTSNWFETLLVTPEESNKALDFSLDFGISWAKGHLEAGADAIVLVDGLATATSIPKDVFQEKVIPLYENLTNTLDAPVVFYTAGGNILPFAEEFQKTGVIGVFPSADDSLKDFKDKSKNNYTLFGNLNNLELGDWTTEFMEKAVKKTIETGKSGGKYVLSTQHMIPHNVSIEKVAKLINIALKYAYY
jgi:uroporphyrinogen decarboxylase